MATESNLSLTALPANAIAVIGMDRLGRKFFLVLSTLSVVEYLFQQRVKINQNYFSGRNLFGWALLCHQQAT
jgi:hypothetical protein